MIDGNSTTLDWQRHTGDIIVLPVGSLEQHSAHMPLNTDSVHAEYFGKLIAERFDAALLPTIQIANCFEHSGFRGSFSLRPETLMQLVRDIVDEVERQNFRFVILVNGHGGNFALGPVVRHINRGDRPVKIIIVASWQFCPPGITEASKHGHFDMHSGEGETSGMMHVAPDAVRELKLGQPPTEWKVPFKQSDLNTFGLGHYTPDGHVGNHQAATAEKGARMTREALEPMFEFIEDRIEHLRRQPLYAGVGGLTIRPMVPSDMPELTGLVEQANWNQLPNDWSDMMDLAPDSCMVMVRDGKALGSAVTMKYGTDVAWIGMVIVDKRARRMGIASKLMKDAIARGEACAVVKLDATPEGREVYKKLGFVDEYGLTRLVGQGWVNDGGDSNVERYTASVLPELIAYDAAAFGAERGALIERYAANAPDLIRLARKNGKLSGFCLARPGLNYTQIGPVEADDAETANRLVDAVANHFAGQPIVLDVLDDNAEFVKTLRQRGLAPVRPLIRMRKGDDKHGGDVKRYFAVAGYEFG